MFSFQYIHANICNIDMDVSENSGFYPQIIHFNRGFAIIFTIHFGGKSPIFWFNTHIYVIYKQKKDTNMTYWKNAWRLRSAIFTDLFWLIFPTEPRGRGRVRLGFSIGAFALFVSLQLWRCFGFPAFASPPSGRKWFIHPHTPPPQKKKNLTNINLEHDGFFGKARNLRNLLLFRGPFF